MKFWRTFWISFAVTVVCFAILIFRVLFPYHRIIAVSLYVISWIVYVVPYLKKSRIEKLKKNKELRFLGRNWHLIISLIAFFIVLYTMYLLFPIDNIDLGRADKENLDIKLDSDSEYVMKVITSMETNMDSLLESGLLDMDIQDSNPMKSKELKERFSRIVDHIVILEGFADEYRYFYQLGLLDNRDLNYRAFLISYSAYVAKYKLIFELTKSSAYAETVMNEELPIFGTNVYQGLKDRYSHPETIIKINTGRAYLRFASGDDELSKYSHEAYWDLFGGLDHTVKITMTSIFDTFETHTMDTWLPVQKRIANVLGETKLTTRHEYFITEEQISEFNNILEPGDIMFQRRNWYVSNAGMPGFWTHSAFYVGTLEKLDEYFMRESAELFGMPVSQYLKINYPDVYDDKLNGTLTTIEGKAPGVIMLSMEESANADYLAFLRPRLTKQDKLLALMYAFEIYNKPYDYDFDFSTDDSFVCSEVVYKAYLPTSDKNGLNYQLSTVAGRPMLAPNDMVRRFDETYGTSEQQNDFVYYLNGNEELGIAVPNSVDGFRESWKRSKYGFMLE